MPIKSLASRLADWLFGTETPVHVRTRFPRGTPLMQQPAIQEHVVAMGLSPCSVCGTPQSLRRTPDGAPMPGTFAVHFAAPTDQRPCPGSWPTTKARSGT